MTFSGGPTGSRTPVSTMPLSRDPASPWAQILVPPPGNAPGPPAFQTSVQLLHQSGRSWFPRLDSNQDKQIQSLLCYRYTTWEYNRSLAPPRRLALPNTGLTSRRLDSLPSVVWRAVEVPPLPSRFWRPG